MPNAARTYRFEAALSFVGPHRETGPENAELVATRLGRHRFFFDDGYEPEILRDDIDVLLQRSYPKKASSFSPTSRVTTATALGARPMFASFPCL
jgi:hypothetical protein